MQLRRRFLSRVLERPYRTSSFRNELQSLLLSREMPGARKGAWNNTNVLFATTSSGEEEQPVYYDSPLGAMNLPLTAYFTLLS